MKIKASIILIIITAGIIHGQYNYGFDFAKTGSAGLQFLKIGIGARETAMGEAVTGSVKDVNAVFWNPAGLAYVNNYQATFSHTNWLVDSKQMAAAVAIPFSSFTIAVSAAAFSINDFEETTVTNPEGTGRMVSAGDAMIGIAAARMFTNHLSIGGQVKYIHEKLDDYGIGNVLFDIGALYYTGFRNLRLAFSLQHFGPDMKMVDQEFRTPLLFRLNATDEIFDTKESSLTAAVELVHSTDNVEVLNLGSELKLYDFFFLRAGYRVNVNEGKLSFGCGVVSPQITKMNFRVDYSFVKSEIVFDNIHRFTLGISF